MALVADVYCQVCGKTKHEVVTLRNICNSCRKAEEDKQKRVHLAGLKGLTVEERLEKIEEWIYDQENNKSNNTYC
jgi:hypothetical protein